MFFAIYRKGQNPGEDANGDGDLHTSRADLEFSLGNVKGEIAFPDGEKSSTSRAPEVTVDLSANNIESTNICVFPGRKLHTFSGKIWYMSGKQTIFFNFPKTYLVSSISSSSRQTTIRRHVSRRGQKLHPQVARVLHELYVYDSFRRLDLPFIPIYFVMVRSL